MYKFYFQSRSQFFKAKYYSLNNDILIILNYK